VPVDQPDQHPVTERIPAALAGGLDQTVRFVRSQIRVLLSAFCPWSGSFASAEFTWLVLYHFG